MSIKSDRLYAAARVSREAMERAEFNGNDAEAVYYSRQYETLCDAAENECALVPLASLE